MFVLKIWGTEPVLSLQLYHGSSKIKKKQSYPKDCNEMISAFIKKNFNVESNNNLNKKFLIAVKEYWL